MNVLIVDDDPDQLAIRKMLLSQFGFEVSVASDGVSALRVARAKKPVCVLLDLRIPTEDAGLRLIRKLKEKYPRMRILVLTGGRRASFEAMPERALVAGVIEKGSPATELLKGLKGAVKAGER